mgnify:CR=1 FL=1
MKFLILQQSTNFRNFINACAPKQTVVKTGALACWQSISNALSGFVVVFAFKKRANYFFKKPTTLLSTINNKRRNNQSSTSTQSNKKSKWRGLPNQKWTSKSMNLRFVHAKKVIVWKSTVHVSRRTKNVTNVALVMIVRISHRRKTTIISCLRKNSVFKKETNSIRVPMVKIPMITKKVSQFIFKWLNKTSIITFNSHRLTIQTWNWTEKWISNQQILHNTEDDVWILNYWCLFLFLVMILFYKTILLSIFFCFW